MCIECLCERRLSNWLNLVRLRGNQSTIGAEFHSGLTDVAHAEEADVCKLGKRTVLLSSHTGSPWDIGQDYQVDLWSSKLKHLAYWVSWTLIIQTDKSTVSCKKELLHYLRCKMGDANNMAPHCCECAEICRMPWPLCDMEGWPWLCSVCTSYLFTLASHGLWITGFIDLSTEQQRTGRPAAFSVTGGVHHYIGLAGQRPNEELGYL